MGSNYISNVDPSVVFGTTVVAVSTPSLQRVTVYNRPSANNCTSILFPKPAVVRWVIPNAEKQARAEQQKQSNECRKPRAGLTIVDQPLVTQLDGNEKDNRIEYHDQLPVIWLNINTVTDEAIDRPPPNTRGFVFE